MTQEWTPIVVAIVSGVLLLPPAVMGLVGVLAGRNEPRRVKELRALNEVLLQLPEDDPARRPLIEYRTRLGIAYSERAVRGVRNELVTGSV